MKLFSEKGKVKTYTTYQNFNSLISCKQANLKQKYLNKSIRKKIINVEHV